MSNKYKGNPLKWQSFRLEKKNIEILVFLNCMFESNARSDVALIRLESTVEFNDFIWPACINTDPNKVNWPFVTAIGFGITSLGKQMSHI